MGLVVKETSGTSYEQVPEGVHIGVCVSVIDLGTHYDDAWNKRARKVSIRWELPELRIERDRDGAKRDLPMSIGRLYSLSLHELSTLRRDLEAWRGRKFTSQELKGFDLKALLGAACQLQVVHSEKKDGQIRSAVAAIMALPKGAKKPKPENELQFFSFDDGGPAPAGLPEWMDKMMRSSEEFARDMDGTAPEPTQKPKPETPAEDDELREYRGLRHQFQKPKPETPAEDDVPF